MSKENFFTQLFANLFRPSDPEAVKKRQLKSIAKDLSKCKYKYYKFQTNEILPPFGKLFYDIYKIIAPAQIMFQNNKNKNIYKSWVIDYSMTKEELEAVYELSEEKLAEKARSMPLKELESSVLQAYSKVSASFDTVKIQKIDALYTKLLQFISFCCFDYYFVLKKFDSNLREREFSIPPKLDSIRGEYLADDIKDFASVAFSIPHAPAEWSDVFAMLKDRKDVLPIAAGTWNKILNRLKDLRNTNTLDMMIQLITENPEYATQITVKQEHITESYLEAMKKSIDEFLDRMRKKQQDSKTDEILRQIFETTSVVRLKNYIESSGQEFVKKNLPGFTYAPPLNYMKAFLLDYAKKDIRNYCDLVLIRGKWTTNTLSAQMSDAYHKLLEVSDKITAFDEMLSESGEYGSKFKTYMLRVDRDQEARNVMNSILRDINGNARKLITTSAQELIVIGRNVKSLLEDYGKIRHELVTNWKELEHFSDQPIKTLSVEIYKKIYLIVTLMQIYLQKLPNEDND